MSVLSPDIIVLDEPSSNLDSGAIEKLKDILAQWKAQGKTIVIAEHRLYFLRELADRMLIMENGRIILIFICFQPAKDMNSNLYEQHKVTFS